MPVGIDEYTKLLLHCYGADASTTFTDSSLIPKTVTANGTAQIDTDQYKFNGSSCLFPGNSGSYLSVPSSSDFEFGSDNFTVDFWFRMSSAVTWSEPVRVYTDSSNRWMFYLHSDGYWYFTAIVGGSTKANYKFSNNLSINTWYHVAIVRSGTSFYIFIGGSAKSLTTVTAISTNNINNSGILSLGTSSFSGWIDEFRISKGIARWTENFTAPTEEYYRIAAVYEAGRRNRLNIKGVSTFNQLA